MQGVPKTVYKTVAKTVYNLNMVKIEFASSITRHTQASSFEAEGESVADALADVFRRQPSLRTYVLDDQGAVRKHITIFVNDRTIADREKLSDSVNSTDCIHVYQALSGG